jgi:hypothetical protein
MILNAYGYSTTEPQLRCWAFPPSPTCIPTYKDTIFCDDGFDQAYCEEYPDECSCWDTTIKITTCTPGTCTGNGPDSGNYLSGKPRAVDIDLQYFGNIMSNFLEFNSSTGGGNLSQSDLTKEIDAGRPIIASWIYPDQSGHDVLIIGYDGTGGSDAGNVAYLDPDPSSFGRHVKPYAAFVQTGNQFLWDETLRLTTNPAIPIGTPVGGTNWVKINSGGTTAIFPGTNSLKYSARSCCYSSTTWNWNLILTDINGDVIVASGTQSTNNKDSTTWNISNFTLPAGHHWNYDFSGKIPGRVEITAIIGSASVKDAKDVVYVPSVLYPGNIVSVNQTISSSQADVKAHNSIQIVGDQVTNTGTVNFKAGQSITILPETKILPGSKVNITIDPTLQ